MIRRGQAPGQPNHQWCVGRYLHGNQPRKPPFCPIRHTDAAARYHLEISAAEADPTYHPGPADQAGPRAHRARGDGPPHGRRDASNASDRRTSGQNWRPRLPPVSRPNRIAIGPLLAARRPRDGSRCCAGGPAGFSGAVRRLRRGFRDVRDRTAQHWSNGERSPSLAWMIICRASRSQSSFVNSEVEAISICAHSSLATICSLVRSSGSWVGLSAFTTRAGLGSARVCSRSPSRWQRLGGLLAPAVPGSGGDHDVRVAGQHGSYDL